MVRTLRFRLHSLLFLMALVITLATPTVAKSASPPSMSVSATLSAVAAKPPLAAQALFAAGHYQAAIAALEPRLHAAQQQGDRTEQAIILSNLALSYQQLGNWTVAHEHITTALNLLQGGTAIAVRAQALDVRGSLEFAQGQTEAAIASWAEATTLYQQTNNLERAVMSQINLAQAFQQLGLSKRVVTTLSALEQTLASQPDSLIKASALRAFSEALRVTGDLPQAQTNLQQSLAIATRLQAPTAIAETQLSLGNLARAEAKLNFEQDNLKGARTQFQAALTAYKTAAAAAPTPLLQTQATLNQLNLWLETPAKVRSQLNIWAEVQTLHDQLQTLLPTLPPGRMAIDLQAGFGYSLIQWRQLHPGTAPAPLTIAHSLADAVQAAKTLNDPRALSAATGYLGRVYEQVQQWPEAQRLTQSALLLAQANNASDLAYRWQWQLGRVLRAQGQQQEAIAAYTEAFTTLQSLKRDLIAINSDIKFSFRETAEPVYRQLVDLLLQTPTPTHVHQARLVLESLQVAELQNFLQTGCQDTDLQDTRLQIDQIVDRLDPTAAVIYPIILDDRLEVLLKLPGQTALYQPPPIKIPRQQLTATLRQFQESLQDPYRREVQTNGQVVYNWLIQPIQAQLEKNGIQTLIFALDGPLRTIPMAALYDGQHYLVEHYAVTLILGLDVREPAPLDRNRLHVLAASLTDPPPGFERYDPLVNVNPEINQIQAAGLPATLIRDQSFTRNQLKQELNQGNFQIIHLATHGEFGKNRKNTFILAADGAISVDELDSLFRIQKQSPENKLELLVLSACKTATGDDRAVLGIAGTAVKAGAQSAIAGLWTLADEPSVTFTHTLYQSLGQPHVTRAEALRRAQVALLQDPQFSHPRYWAPYVLVGSWL